MSRLSRTSDSFYLKASSPNKINFQTKLKIRGTNQYFKNNQLQQGHSQNERSNHDLSSSIHFNKSLSNFPAKNSPQNQTFYNLTRLNFSHHNSQHCLCNECLCGRHVCKLHVVQPDLRKSTTYQKSFTKFKGIKNNRVLIKQQNRSLPKVQMNSTYTHSFRDKDPNIVIKHHPQDQLKFEGPLQKLTMYKVNYPGNRGRNPYVRPKQTFARGQFPLKNKKSSYRQNYHEFQDFKMTQSGRINDQLKTGNEALFRQSFYQQKFKSPNPQDYRPIVKNKQKLQTNPRYAHQYETNYDNQFVPIKTMICPAKIKAQTQLKDKFTNTRNLFNQNSDFKALSSTFHALSTAPFGQYQ